MSNQKKKAQEAFEMVKEGRNGMGFTVKKIKENYIGKVDAPWLSAGLNKALKIYKERKKEGIKGIKYYKGEAVIAAIDLETWEVFGRVRALPNGRKFYVKITKEPINHYQKSALSYFESSIAASDRKELLKIRLNLPTRRKVILSEEDIDKI